MNVFSTLPSISFIADGTTPEIVLQVKNLPANVTGIPYGTDAPDSINVLSFDGNPPTGITAAVHGFTFTFIFATPPSSGEHTLGIQLIWNLN